MAEDVRWVSAPDGTRIAYSVVGEGPALMLTNGLTTTRAFWKYLAADWQQKYKVIRWDLPGHGLSHKPLTPECVAIERQPAIMRRILDEVRVERAAHLGFSVGCQIVLEMARQEPARCTAVVLLLGAGGRVFDTLDLPIGKLGPQVLLKLPGPAFRLWYRAMASAAQLPQSGPVAKRLGLVGASAKDEDVEELAAHLGTLEPLSIQRMARSAAEHSAHDLLTRLELPLLIFGGAKDPFAPIESVARKLAALAPHGELVELPLGTHTAMLDDPAPISEAVQRFLEKHAARLS